ALWHGRAAPPAQPRGVDRLCCALQLVRAAQLPAAAQPRLTPAPARAPTCMRGTIMPEPIWQADTLIHYPLIEHVDIAADGRVLYTVRRPYLTDEASEFRRTLYLASPGAAPRALTGVEDASQPRWSPDGMWIAFLRPTEPTGKPRLWIMPAHGGEPWPITGKENGIRGAVTRFAWRPDSRSIAFTSVPWDEEQEAKRKRREDVRHWR